MSMLIRLSGMLVFVFLLLAMEAAGDPPKLARFACDLRKTDDTFEVVTPKPGAEVFRIRSASGIGGAKITCREGKWPETITIVFGGMCSLEGFGMAGNGVTAQGRLGFDHKPQVFYFGARGESLPDATGSAYRLALEYRKDEGVRVTLTAPPTARTTKSWA